MGTINSESVAVATGLDEYAAGLSISRKEREEDLNDFNERVRVAQENLYKTGPEAFKTSLDYITHVRTKDVLTLSFTDDVDLFYSEIKINSNTLYIKVDIGEEYAFNLEQYKFIYSLREVLGTIDKLVIQESDLYEDLKFEKSINFLNTTSSKKLVSFESSKRNIPLPVANVIEVVDQRDMFTKIDFGDGEIFNQDEEDLKMVISYIDIPITLQWNQLKVVECNSDLFKSMLKNRDGFLTSDGASLINQILEKQNTYWGK